MAVSTQTKASVAVGFIALATALTVGAILYPQLAVSNGGRRMAIHWQTDGGDTPPSGTIVCIQQTGVGLAAALPLFGLDAGAGLNGYAICRACAPQLDDTTPVPSLPAGISALKATQDEVDFDGGPQFWCALQGEPEFPCACSTGPGCLGVDGGAAQTGITLAAGAWSGACMTKACTELAGFSSWPTECGAQ